MKEQELTPWFVNGEKPVRCGAYMVRGLHLSGYAFWSDAHGWGGMCGTPNDAALSQIGANPECFHTGGRSWRGLAQDPEAMP